MSLKPSVFDTFEVSWSSLWSPAWRQKLYSRRVLRVKVHMWRVKSYTPVVFCESKSISGGSKAILPSCFASQSAHVEGQKLYSRRVLRVKVLKNTPPDNPQTTPHQGWLIGGVKPIESAIPVAKVDFWFGSLNDPRASQKKTHFGRKFTQKLSRGWLEHRILRCVLSLGWLDRRILRCKVHIWRVKSYTPVVFCVSKCTCGGSKAILPSCFASQSPHLEG